MRNNKKALLSSRRRIVLVVFFSVIALAVIGTLTLYALHVGPFKSPAPSANVGVPTNGIDYNPPTPEQTSTGDAAKQQTTNGATGSDPSPAPTPSTTGSSKPQVGMDITAANIDSTAGVLRVRTLIQTVTSSGTCTLTASGPNGKTYTASAGVQAGPSTSTCKGFDIPISSLSSGNWSIQVSFENDSLQATASTEKSL